MAGPGYFREAVTGSGGHTSLQTRDVALRGAQGEWLAVLRVQTNVTSDTELVVAWQEPSNDGLCAVG